MHPLTPPVSIASLASIVPVCDPFELSGYNLATHTSAFGQAVTGKPFPLAANDLAVLPPTVCGKRSRANSAASSSDSSTDAGSYNNSVFSSESSYDSPNSVEQTTPSRKLSTGQNADQQLDDLASWRASVLMEQQAARSTKRVKALHDHADRADQKLPGLSDVAQAAATEPAPPTATLPASVSTRNRSASPTSSASPECKNTFVDCLVGKLSPPSTLFALF